MEAVFGEGDVGDVGAPESVCEGAQGAQASAPSLDGGGIRLVVGGDEGVAAGAYSSGNDISGLVFANGSHADCWSFVRTTWSSSPIGIV